jgi:ribosomal protein S18 acetylase RimI-like enzyme
VESWFRSKKLTGIHLDGMDFSPLTRERWEDFETLFGPKGACAGCWCMYWRLPRSQFNAKIGDNNRLAMQALVADGVRPGLLAYQSQQAVGWVSLGSREQFLPLERSRTLHRVDDQPVWSLVCFYIDKAFRRQGLMLALIRAGAVYAAQEGAAVLEAYPVATPPGQMLPPFTNYMGMEHVFTQAGFERVAQTTGRRVIMRLKLAKLPPAG